MSGRLFDFNQLVLAVFAALLVTGVFLGASWVALDRAQAQLDRTLPDLEVLLRTPFAYPDVFMNLAQALPLLQANELPVQDLEGASAELQRAWLAGRSMRTSRANLQQQLDLVAQLAAQRSQDMLPC